MGGEQEFKKADHSKRQRWIISKDTVRDIRKGDICEREIERLYPGYTITDISPYLNTINAGEYLTIRLRKTKNSRVTKEVFYKCRK